jgi:hypothetical protein
MDIFEKIRFLQIEERISFSLCHPSELRCKPNFISYTIYHQLKVLFPKRTACVDTQPGH